MLLLSLYKEKQKKCLDIEKEVIKENINYLYDVWTDIVLKHSSEICLQLKSYKREVLHNLMVNISTNIPIKYEISKQIGIQCDRIIVELIIYGSLLLKDDKLINKIYERTKYSIPMYFYDDLFFKAYLEMENIYKIEELINHIFKLYKNKNTYAYLYKILQYKPINYKPFDDFLNEKQIECNAELLKKGQKIDLINVSLEEIKRIIDISDKKA